MALAVATPAAAACVMRIDVPDAELFRLIDQWREADARNEEFQAAYNRRFWAWADELKTLGMTMEDDHLAGGRLCKAFGAWKCTPEEQAAEDRELELARMIIITSPRTFAGAVAKADFLRTELQLNRVGDGPDCLTEAELSEMDWDEEAQLRFINELADMLGSLAVQS
jgi:hypothetical protein